MFNSKVKSIMCGFLISVLFSFINFSCKCDSISEKIFRLHILANSDSTDDQNLKIKVRNKIIENICPDFSDSKDIIDAENLMMKNLGKIENIARKEITDNGYDYSVKVEIKNMFFNTRKYNEITIPAGNYDALRVTIGKGEGRNWWCVMFPPMCLSAAKETTELSYVLNSSEMEIVENEINYEFEFKLVEVFCQYKNFINDKISEIEFSPIKNINLLEPDSEYDLRMFYH